MLVQVLFPEGIVQGLGEALKEPVWARIGSADKNVPKAPIAKNKAAFAIVAPQVLSAL